MTAYDIILIDFPFEDKSGGKVRPALLLPNQSAMLIGAKITSKLDKYNSDNDYKVVKWKKAGLLKPSVVRLDKLFKTSSEHVIKVIGHLDDVDISNIKNILKNNK